MQLTTLLSAEEENRAVSPVIGVILMVAITVILAAVIASFVLGLGGEQEVAPQAQFDFNYNNDSNMVRITHTSGDTIRHDRLTITGEGLDLSTSSSPGVNGNGYWNPDNATGSVGGVDAVESGDTAPISTDGDADFIVRVVWESSSGDTTSELASHEGPGY